MGIVVEGMLLIGMLQGGILMENKKCELPLGSYRNHSKLLRSL